MKSAIDYQQAQAREAAATRAEEIKQQIEEQRLQDEERRLAHEASVQLKAQQLAEFERRKQEEHDSLIEESRRDAARRVEVLGRVKEQDMLYRTFAKQQLSKKVGVRFRVYAFSLHSCSCPNRLH